MEGYVVTSVDVTDVVCPETRVREDVDEPEEEVLLETPDRAELDDVEELSEDEELEEVELVFVRRPMLATTTTAAVIIMMTKIARRTTLPRPGLPLVEVRTNRFGCDNEIAPC